MSYSGRDPYNPSWFEKLEAVSHGEKQNSKPPFADIIGQAKREQAEQTSKMSIPAELHHAILGALSSLQQLPEHSTAAVATRARLQDYLQRAGLSTYLSSAVMQPPALYNKIKDTTTVDTLLQLGLMVRIACSGSSDYVAATRVAGWLTK